MKLATTKASKIFAFDPRQLVITVNRNRLVAAQMQVDADISEGTWEMHDCTKCEVPVDTMNNIRDQLFNDAQKDFFNDLRCLSNAGSIATHHKQLGEESSMLKSDGE